MPIVDSDKPGIENLIFFSTLQMHKKPPCPVAHTHQTAALFISATLLPHCHTVR